MSDIQDLSEARTQIISPAQALRQLISPPETHSQIRMVMRAFLPVVQLMPEILAEDIDPDMVILRDMLPSIIHLCQAIRDESKEASSWEPTSEKKPQITPYPTYRALLEIGDKHCLSDEQQRLLAHVFIAIWRGVTGTDDGRVPASNLQHVFLEYRRPHLWRDNLEAVDTSLPNECYADLKKREDSLKNAHDLVFKHIAPIRRLLGLSLGHESIRERDGEKDADEREDSDETQTSDAPELDTSKINIELSTGDGASDESIIGYVTPLVAKDGSEDRTLQIAEHDTVPAIDAVNSVILAAASSGSASRKALGGRHIAAQNHAIANQVKNAVQTLTIQWDRLTEYDLYVLWDEISEPDDTEFLAALAIQLMVLTGRPLKVVLDTQLKSRVADLPDTTSNDRIYLCRETATWQARVPLPKRVRPIEPELQQRLIPSVSQVRLPIVASLWDALTRHTGTEPGAWRGSLFKSLSKETIIEQAHALLERVIKTHGGRLKENRIQRALFNRIADGSGDMVEAIVITGNARSYGQHIGIYYHCALESDLQQTYLTAISRMLPEFKEHLAPAMTQRPSGKAERRIGSPYCPRRHAVKTLVSDLKRHIDDVRRQPITKSTFADIHNAYALYTVFLLFFSTGYRSVKAPLSRLTDIDLSSRYMVIADKTGDDWSHSRLVPLADVFVSHWQNYLSHRRHVIRLMETYLGQGDPGHALFFLSTKERQGIQAQEMIPTQITMHVSPFSNMPLNVSRHYLRSELRHRNLPGSMVDAFMGHWIAGKEPMGRFSTLSPKVFRDTLTPVLDEILAEAGWVAIRGLGQ